MIASRIKHLVLFLSVCVGTIYAQEWSVDTTLFSKIDEVVVTATRNERLLSNITVPTLTVHQKAILLSGNIRLNDVLQEQTGLFTTSGTGSGAVGGGVFGNGIQIQGMSPDYTLIMLDGEPLIGRQGGVLDLSRFTVGNIKKLEIIKGPSSALYGSEAMGGVINIITDQKRNNSFNGGVRYGAFNLFDTWANASIDHKKSTFHLFANFNSSEGYDLQPQRPERTLDPYKNMSFQAKWTYRITDRTKLIWNNRYFSGIQNSEFAINSNELNVSGQGITSDFNINPVINHLFNDNLKTSFRLYASGYRYDQVLSFTNSIDNYYDDNFNHLFYRVENQTDYKVSDKSDWVLGAGYNIQTVETIRYNGQKSQQIGYGFIQNEYRPTNKWIIIPGLRYDANSDYANRWTPKLSAQYKHSSALNINFSYGSGFKAPDFRQLYLFYVNPAAQGYRIYGASEFSLPELQRQQQEGIIARILDDAYRITELRPEISHGFNLGGNLTLKNNFAKLDFNLFYNHINDLINYLPVATLQNNALVFSYLNVKRAYTGGLEMNLQGTYQKYWNWSVGYQFLMTGDRQIVDDIKDNKVFGRDNPLGSARIMQMKDYTGLLGRSPFMANAKILYQSPKNGWGGSLRAIYRSRWGVTDLDGNGFANMPEEFAPGFVTLNFSLQKEWNKKFTTQLLINNILNHIDPVNAPQMPGTHINFGILWNFENKGNH